MDNQTPLISKATFRGGYHAGLPTTPIRPTQPLGLKLRCGIGLDPNAGTRAPPQDSRTSGLTTCVVDAILTTTVVASVAAWFFFLDLPGTLEMPEGQLTAAQFEIMVAVWNAGRDGATVTQIWQAICEDRDVARTTILNLVDRLEKRGWLRRKSHSGANRFVAAVPRERAQSTLARTFLRDFFDGSTSQLVMSLLGSNRLDREELDRLRTLLDSTPSGDNKTSGTGGEE